MIQEGELIIGYGRRHWLHFQENKLVKIQSTSPFFSQEILNKIPLRDFFDNDDWKINKQVPRESSFAEVKLALKLNTPLNKHNQLILQNQNNTLTLDFLAPIIRGNN